MDVLRQRWPFFALFLAVAIFILGSGCGGGSNSQPPPGNVTVSVSPANANVFVKLTQTFTATVTGSSNTAVSWSVQEAAGGTISSTGIYTAPNTAGTYHITASSQADPSKTATATAAVALPPAPVFSSSPPSAASEGSQYTYELAASDPAGGTVAFGLTSGPTGAAISGKTLNWTPAAQQSRISNGFTVTATTSEGATATQTWTVVPNGIIRGHEQVTYVNESGETVPVPSNLSSVPIKAIIPRADGGFDVRTGVGATDGTFSIPDVPAGDYWLVWNQFVYMWMNSSNLNRDYAALGRRFMKVASAGTNLQLSATSLNGWQSTDYLNLYVPNIGTAKTLSPTLALGATSMASQTVAWDGLFLPDASAGDKTYVSQMVSNAFGVGTDRLNVMQKYATNQLTMDDAVTKVLPVELADVSLSNSFPLNVKGTAFEALVPQMYPQATRQKPTLSVSALPSPEKWGIRTGPAAELAVYSGASAITSDLNEGNINYGNPFGSVWKPFFIYSEKSCSPAKTVPGLPGPISSCGPLEIADSVFPTADAPLQPLVGPPTNVRIEGASLFDDQTVNTATPTLTWEPPTLGTANLYYVAVLPLTSTGPQVIPAFYTTKQSVTLPPGVLVAGNPYFITVFALSQPNGGNTTMPFPGETLPYSYAAATSGVITVSSSVPMALNLMAAEQQITSVSSQPALVRRDPWQVDTPGVRRNAQ